MPRVLESFLPPAPIRKSAPAPIKPAGETARPEDFRDALKSATSKKAEQSPKPEEKPAAKTTTAKKPAAKATSKAATKAAKSKATEREDPEAAEVAKETDSGSEAQAQTQLPVEAQAESAQAQTAPTAEAHGPHGHPDADPDSPAATSPTDLAASQLVQPIDHPKDQPQKRSKEEHSDDAEEAKAVPQPVEAAAAALANASAAPVAKSTSARPATSAAKPAQAKAIQPEKVAATATAGTSATDAIPLDQSDQSPEQDGQVSQDAAAQTAGATKTTRPAQAAIPLDAPLAPVPGAVKPKPNSKQDLPTDSSSDATAAGIANLNLPAPADTDADHSDKSASDALDLAAAPITPDLTVPSHAQPAAANKPADLPPPAPEVEFAQTNHDKIVSSVQSQLLPHGGAMQIRLDPPELGALKVMVEMRDGVMNATFQTSNEQATQLLSHSLNQLKHVLESQGVTVERLQVQQAPKSDNASTPDDRQQQQQQQRDASDHHTAQQEQQRKELLQKMWRKVSGVADPIDYFA
jgi:flagellar hook-length control protein FliK